MGGHKSSINRAEGANLFPLPPGFFDPCFWLSSRVLNPRSRRDIPQFPVSQPPREPNNVPCLLPRTKMFRHRRAQRQTPFLRES
jgi:hypothetical protein